MEQIIIVEDDRSLGDGLCKALKTEERTMCLCESIEALEEQMLCGNPSLIILDINLPDGNGLEFLRKLREKGNKVPVILLTANDTDADIVRGLENGADDYITKPFSLAVLRARVNAQLRKPQQSAKDGSTIIIDDYSFNFERMEFSYQNERVELSKTEQKLLRLLVENKGITLSRDVLIDRIWTDGADFVDENALSVSIKRLRDKLHATDYIRTIYGVGYAWRRQDG